MRARKILGAVMVATPFVSVAVFAMMTLGWWVTLAVFAGVVLIVLLISYGVTLLFD